MDYKLIFRRFLYFYFMWFFIHVVGRVLFGRGTHAETGAYLYTATPYVISLAASIGMVILTHLKDKGKVI